MENTTLSAAQKQAMWSDPRFGVSFAVEGYLDRYLYYWKMCGALAGVTETERVQVQGEIRSYLNLTYA